MRITDDVALPEPLITAAATGDLVLFVGAGASMNAPACLPSFDDLAEQLANAAGVEFDARIESDAFIGRLCDSDSTIRELARTIIGNAESKPNDTHRAIMRLSNACGDIRIVTTNYDEHLSTAAAELSIDIGEVYRGPAVPLGRDFTGLVHLHGQVSRAASELVITDDDFGRAYLFDGWARRFVTDLFLNRTVLFVGYSHSDTVMKYLARGLPPTTKRFALTDTPDDQKWNDLRITPVEYPNSNQHAALTIMLNEWSSRLKMGQLDHHTRILEIISGGPPKLPVEEDYLAMALNLPAGVRAFAEKARGEEWLLWAEQQPAFLSLFRPGNQTSDQGEVLARWFTENYVENPEMTDFALATLARHGPIVCTRLRQLIAYSAHDLRKSSPELARRWAVIVVAALRTHDEDPEKTWNLLYQPPVHGRFALPLLRRALQPRIELSIERPWQIEETDARDRVTIDVRWSSSKSDLQHLWKAVQDGVSAITTPALQIFEQSLYDAYELLEACTLNKRLDKWSYRRSAIEPHEQDQITSYESTLIDALRDTSTEIVGMDTSIIERWVRSDFNLFRRLGLHLLASHATMAPSNKLAFILSESYIYDHLSKHEVFRLLAAIAPELNKAERHKLLNHALEGPPPFDAEPELEAELHDRCIFDVLEWLTRYVNGWEELERAVATIREKRPMFATRKHPDFNSWMESGTWVEKPAPFTVEEFIGEFRENGPAGAVTLAVNQLYSTNALEGPTWQSACLLVRQAIESHPDAGLMLLTEPVLSEDPEREGDFRIALLNGMKKSELTEQQIDLAIESLMTIATDVRLTRPISDLALSFVDGKAPKYSESSLNQLDSLVNKLWCIHSVTVEKCESNDWLMLGYNTWPGVLTQYWINRIRIRWKDAGADWRGLSEADKDTATRLLDPASDATQASLAIITADTYFFFCADPEFTREQIFPLFELTIGERAVQAWRSYLHHPRSNGAMLESGFWQLLTSACNLVTDLGSELQLDNQYWRMMAVICIRSDAEIVSVSRFFGRLTQPNQAGSFIAAIAEVLNEISEAESTSAWNRWIAETIRTRLSRISVGNALEERSAWGDLALRMVEPISMEALELTDVAPGPLGQNTTFSDPPEEIISAYPNRIARIVANRLAHTLESDWHIQHELEGLVRRLRQSGVSDSDLRNLAEQAIQSGIYNSASWISDSKRVEQ